jgi:hypothetical protein
MVKNNIFKNKNWFIDTTGRSGWIIGTTRAGQTIGDNWVIYDDYSVAFDQPEKLPEYIKAKVRFYALRLKEMEKPVTCDHCGTIQPAHQMYRGTEYNVLCYGCWINPKV